MFRKTSFYIDGQWQEPLAGKDYSVIDPAMETAFAMISLGGDVDVDRAVVAAARAFTVWQESARYERIELLERLLAIYTQRMDEMAQTISREMGAPMTLASGPQVQIARRHIRAMIDVLKDYQFDHPLRADAPNDRILHQPIGVCGLITPWNWPMNQIAQKVAAALAAGCTIVLKPSELAPLSAMLFAEMIDEAGFPAGVFNLVNGDGPGVGHAIARHPTIRMVSLTGSGRAGEAVMLAAAPTFKRVVLELGGKGANIIFGDSGIAESVRRGTLQCFNNTGQSCNAPTRMLVERSYYDEAVAVAAETARSVTVGPPSEEGGHLGPLASGRQFDIVQDYIKSGIAAGARLVAGGVGRPEGVKRGFYARPTVFADVTPDMRIAREEIFGPVLSIMSFDDEDQAVALANANDLGLANYIQTADQTRAERLARRLESGVVVLNGATRAPGSPFGGMKHSGNGREGGRWGLEEFLEVKAVSGWSS
ncbi:aldehyde dehydrogenase family protein [Roseovarius azorensis]|uniref:aldehyde dehydrogenase family protein n=1 Tax=Roseovarius azorensis TaxID=1287727 RepID=UPI001586FF5B